ncbi:D-inositol-3-phosphate glycosyltransferase [Cupriavidus yeoncheonensis]|uniref:D-inositol-3-phosphate glycosyltransferase n=1 Tax=Cupriavidus yeoncheonensis TaxID=1462994 RepID=A0A916INH5_9BURK|nr:glycosyltransferase family 1 protein [Cupriavidus yeoncheonensis]CAG2128617.1 D-inositol-3-phosphate glycosyltransferase [Cupriavidus yeoncheonensis]
MRLLLDLLPCQTTSRLRGIGRYALALTEALVRSRGSHQMHALADAQFSKACDELRATLSPTLGAGRLASYRHCGVSAPEDERLAAGLVSGAYRVLAPDAVLCLSPFEGWGENGVVPDPGVRVGSSLRVAVLYDLIPWLFPAQYLNGSPSYKAWYTKRLQQLKRFDLLLAISEATRQDAIQQLGIDPHRIAVIGGAADQRFRPQAPGEALGDISRLGIERPFVLYTGNADYRKNLSGMLQGFARLPEAVRRAHQLVVNQTGDRLTFWKQAKALGLSEDDIVVTGHVDDDELVALYQQCKVFVFPSLYEGFGLPVLEAMACGAPVIAANNSSIPEVMGRADVLFSAEDPQSIAGTLSNVLAHESLRQELKTFGLARAAAFSWDDVGAKAWTAIEQAMELPRYSANDAAPVGDSLRPAVSLVTADAVRSGHEPDLARQLASRLSVFANVLEQEQPSSPATITPGSAEPAPFGGASGCGLTIYACESPSPPASLLYEMRANPGVLVLGSSGLAGNYPEAGVRALLRPANGSIGGDRTRPPATQHLLASCLVVVTQTEHSARALQGHCANGWCPPIAVVDMAGDRTEDLQSIVDNAYYLSPSRLVDEVAQVLHGSAVDELLIDRISTSVGHNLRLNRRRRLLIDVTQLAKNDARSGIQRVVRNIVRELCRGTETPPIEIVRLVKGRLVRASGVVASVFECERDAYGESFIDVQPGDFLLMIDSSWEQYEQFLPVFEQVRQFGGRVISVVYDLIPILHPEFCSPGLVSVFSKWLRLAVGESDMLICISGAVKTTLEAYLARLGEAPPRPLLLEHWNLGADLVEIDREAEIRAAVLDVITDQSPLFLLVGTIEPRKGHGFVLDAFERIWAAGGDARLCLAGKQGWHVEALVSRIRNHPMNGKKLFVIEDFTDAEINRCYENATALIAASTIEGYGLPIVEAAMHQVPVLASDIPVFREVGRDGALYFQLGVPSSLQEAVDHISKMTKDERRALAGKIRPITWRESAQQLASKLFEDGAGGLAKAQTINFSSGTEQ